MRLKNITSILVTCFILCSTSCKGNNRLETSDSSDNFLAFKGNFHEEIIKPEVIAWQKVASVMYPRVCDDTETQWTASQVDSLGTALLEHPTMSNGEKLAKLYEIQNMIAYGMSYFVSVIGTHTNPEAAENALMIVQDSYASIDSLKSSGFENARLLIAFEQFAYANFGIFMELGTQYADGEPSFVAKNQEMNMMNAAKTNALFKNLKNEIQAFRYSSIVNNTTFFMTYCPLAFWLAGNDFQLAHQDEYIKIGGWLDEQAAKVNNAIYSNEIAGLPQLSSEEFTNFARQASAYRVRLIHLLEEGISSIPIE